MERVILHSDMNNFYASVECMLNPSLRGKPVAVCGNREDRHGIVLAKNYEAKAYGVATGDVIWQAQNKCKDLLIVKPHYDEYIKFSKLAREIYSRYTDKIEPFGMDECWLDMSGIMWQFSNGEALANEIKETIKFELGLTVSVGVSFNKIFAKLGSDMKKPDAVTCISKDNFKSKIWNLPASDMLGVGRASKKCLDKYGIYTIGDLANTDAKFLQTVMKSHGLVLWRFANGLDNSQVNDMDYVAPIKSVGHGITTSRDICSKRDVWPVILELTQDIGRKLRSNDLSAEGVSVCIRDKDLKWQEWQCKMPMSTQSDMYIAQQALKLLNTRYDWNNDLRSITIRAINLISSEEAVQVDFFNNRANLERMEKLDKVKDRIRERFGNNAIMSAAVLNNGFINTGETNGIRMPTGLLNCR